MAFMSVGVPAGKVSSSFWYKSFQLASSAGFADSIQRGIAVSDDVLPECLLTDACLGALMLTQCSAYQGILYTA